MNSIKYAELMGQLKLDIQNMPAKHPIHSAEPILPVLMALAEKTLSPLVSFNFESQSYLGVITAGHPSDKEITVPSPIINLMLIRFLESGGEIMAEIAENCKSGGGAPVGYFVGYSIERPNLRKARKNEQSVSGFIANERLGKWVYSPIYPPIVVYLQNSDLIHDSRFFTEELSHALLLSGFTAVQW